MVLILQLDLQLHGDSPVCQRFARVRPEVPLSHKVGPCTTPRLQGRLPKEGYRRESGGGGGGGGGLGVQLQAWSSVSGSLLGTSTGRTAVWTAPFDSVGTEDTCSKTQTQTPTPPQTHTLHPQYDLFILYPRLRHPGPRLPQIAKAPPVPAPQRQMS